MAMRPRTKTASWQAFKDFTLASARGERQVGASEPRIWVERIEDGAGRRRDVRFRSLEAGAKLLSARNRLLLRTIAARRPRSISELASMTGRAEQNVSRTLNKLAMAGIVRLDKGEGRSRRPVLAARKILFEIDLMAS